MKSATVRKRIAALRQMTPARGCTEAEALVAAAKAVELMRQYGIRETDLTIGQQSVQRKSEGQSVRDDLWRRLAYCTNTACVLGHERGKAVRIFVGRDPGPEVAAYLYQVLDRAIDRAVAEFKAGRYYRARRTIRTKRQATHEFTFAMLARITVRLMDLFGDSVSTEAREAAGRALDVLFPESAPFAVRPQKAAKIAAASISGYIAGEGVNLAHGVSGGQPAPKMIGAAR